MTNKAQKQYAERLAGILKIEAEEVERAMQEIVREDVFRIARNEKREG